MFKEGFSARYLAVLLVIFLYNVCPTNATARAGDRPLGLATEQRGDSAFPGEAIAYALEIPSPGVLVLEATTSERSTEPAVDVLGVGGGPWTVLDRTTNRWTLAVFSASTLRLQVSSQDPRQALGAFRLVSRFVAAEVRKDVFESAEVTSGLWGTGGVRAERIVLSLKEVSSKTELEEVDPNPGALMGESEGSWVEVLLLSALDDSSLSVAKTELEEVDPNPGALMFVPRIHLQAAWWHHRRPAPKGMRSHRARVALYFGPMGKTELEEVDPDPGALVAGPVTDWQEMASLQMQLPSSQLDGEGRSRALRRFLRAVEGHLLTSAEDRVEILGLCDKGNDDHDGSFVCATAGRWGHPLSGHLQTDGEGDDVDVFRFSMEVYGAVDILAMGPEMVASLYDGEGRRLAISPPVEEVQWLKTLAPGSYFVVLEGMSGADGAYQLRAELR